MHFDDCIESCEIPQEDVLWLTLLPQGQRFLNVAAPSFSRVRRLPACFAPDVRAKIDVRVRVALWASLCRPDPVWPHQSTRYMLVCWPGGVLQPWTARGHSGPLCCLWKEHFINSRVNNVQTRLFYDQTEYGEETERERAHPLAQILVGQNKNTSTLSESATL